MIKVNYYLRNPKKKGKYSGNSKELNINACFTWRGQRTRLSLKEKVKPDEWNPKRQEFRGVSEEIALKNKGLKQIEKKAEKAYDTLIANGIPLTAKNLKFELERTIFPEKFEKSKDTNNLLTFLNWYIDNNPNKIKKGTLKTYMQLVPLFKELIKNEGKIFLEFDSLDLDWESTFTSFLFDKSHSRNTVGRHIKNIKSLMNLSYKKGFHTNLKFKDFTKLSENSYSIYLTEDEIISIYNTEVESHLEHARDVFVFSCLTGLRFSDVMNLKKHNWYDNYLLIETIKTEDQLKIPLRKTAKIILDKYNGELPVFYNQKYNKKIKQICSNVATLKGTISYNISKGNRKTEIIAKKYELVQSHTARRSFATNEYKRGTKTAVIMAITGHKTEKDFWTYIRLSQSEKAENLMEDFQLRDF